ncbi:MAG: DNA/RNA nuclease SfsA [Candidatus Thorarchaeota archaeon]
MNRTPTISKAILLDRPNRFLGRVIYNGKVIDVFIPNPGRMHELMTPGNEVFIRESKGIHRKTDHTMIGLDHNDVTISIDSNLPNRFIKRLLDSYKLPFFDSYHTVISEPRTLGGRFDFKLIGDKESSFIEVKSCTLVENNRAIFPDAPTVRGSRHIRNLVTALNEAQVNRVAVIFVIQRPDARVFSPNDKTDPTFGDALRYGYANGVEIYPLLTRVVNWDLEFIGQVPVELDYFMD